MAIRDKSPKRVESNEDDEPFRTRIEKPEGSSEVEPPAPPVLEDDMVELVRRFRLRELPASGVVSRSRLRNWFRTNATSALDFETFVAKLKQEYLWVPWKGSDLAAESRKEEQGGYREPPKLVREFVVVPQNHLRLWMGFIGLIGGVALAPKNIILALFMMIVSGVFFTRQLSRFRNPARLELSKTTVRVFDNEVIEFAVPDIVWVDVVRSGKAAAAPDGAHYAKPDFKVVISTLDGKETVLLKHLHREVALQACRAVETAMTAAKELARVAKPRVLVERPQELFEESSAGVNDDELER